MSVFKDDALFDDVNEHPYWEYKRVWVWLYYKEDEKVNRKRMYRSIKEKGFLVAHAIDKTKRKQKRNKPKADVG